MLSSDPFHILGLQPGTSHDEVRRAYRKLAMRWHPDRNQHCTASEERFKEIKAAYDMARDADAYSAWQSRRTETADAAAADEERSATREPEASIEQILALSLEEAARGGKRSVLIDRQHPCDRCTGEGKIDQAHSTPCRQCQGIGRLRGASAAEKCPGCAGRGYVRQQDCPDCEGLGHHSRAARFDVTVPPGLRHGETLRLTRREGSILLRVQHLPHAFFALQGDDLHCDVPVDALTWIAGGEIAVPTLGGTIRVPLPAGAPKTEQRLTGQGFPQRDGRHTGDLILHLQTVFPTHLTPAEAAKVAQLATALSRQAARCTPEVHAWQQRLETHAKT